MTDEDAKDERLERFEEVYADFKARRWDGAYAWFDFSVPYGWLDLVVELDGKLGEVLPGYTVAQAKSKFGGLRYYINHPADGGGEPVEGLGYGSEAGQRARALIEEYEERSTKICELCGEPGETCAPTGRWHWTVCPEHEAQLAERRPPGT